MEEEIKQLIELDLMANKIKEECDKKYEAQVKNNNQQIESLKLFKEKEIKAAVEEIETTYTKEINEEIEKSRQKRKKELEETEQNLKKNKDSIIGFLMFNLTQNFNTIK